MNIVSVAKVLNNLKKRKKLRNYAIFGAVGASYYIEPIYTSDVDILILSDTDQEYIQIWRELSKHAEKVRGFGFLINGTEVQILPTSVHPLFRSALVHAKALKTGGITTRVVDIEHLILLSLEANRPKDRFRARILLELADSSYLSKLLKEFDTDGILKERLGTLD